MSLFVSPWTPSFTVPQQNNEPGPVFTSPSLVPSGSPDGYSIFADQQNLFSQVDTDQNFYPMSPSPLATGPNVVTIGGQKYEVTPDNYSSLARQYIQYRRSLGDMSYDDKTPALTIDGSETTVGANKTIALCNAYRQLANLKPTNYSVDPLTGVAIPDNQQYDRVLSNPVFQTADAVSNAGTSLFNAGSGVIQGGSQAVTDLAGVLKKVGDFLKTPGTILVIGAAVGIFFIVKKKVF